MRARRLAIGVIGGLWGLSFVADLLIEDYQPHVIAHSLMMVVFGALVAIQILRDE